MAAPDILRRIAERRRQRLGVQEALPTASARPVAPLSPAENPFLAALSAHQGRAVIAEVKLGSPSLGSLAGRIDPEEQARAYRRGGAAALSVVVEPDFFHGSYELLERCRLASGLPALAKDFLVDVRQLDAAAEAGAAAVLLLASLLSSEELRALAQRARERGLVPLVEVHDRGELERLAGDRWELVGVNSRDLRTFEVDLAHAEALAPALPEGALRVAESGIGTAADVERLRGVGYHAFLVGETLLRAADPEATVRELSGG